MNHHKDSSRENGQILVAEEKQHLVLKVTMTIRLLVHC